jgi:hypothetical protein
MMAGIGVQHRSECRAFTFDRNGRSSRAGTRIGATVRGDIGSPSQPVPFSDRRLGSLRNRRVDELASTSAFGRRAGVSRPGSRRLDEIAHGGTLRSACAKSVETPSDGAGSFRAVAPRYCDWRLHTEALDELKRLMRSSADRYAKNQVHYPRIVPRFRHALRTVSRRLGLTAT